MRTRITLSTDSFRAVHCCIIVRLANIILPTVLFQFSLSEHKINRLPIYAELLFMRWIFEYSLKPFKILFSHVFFRLPVGHLTGLMNWASARLPGVFSGNQRRWPNKNIRRLRITSLQRTTSARWYSVPFDISLGYLTLMRLHYNCLWK